MTRSELRRALVLVAGVAALSACITAPNVVISDRKTALEMQAAGSFHGLSGDLDKSAVSAKPVPYTRGELESAGVPVGKGDEALASNQLATDADQIDQLLTRRCVGEALDGTLVDTAATCTAPIGVGVQARLLERENRRRWQLWRAIIEEKKAAHQPTIEEVQKSWRAVHLGEVICGGQVQVDGGAWEAKKC